MLARYLSIALLCTFLALPAQADDSAADDGAQDESSIAGSGLPVPRFVSLKFETVNLRTGPGTRYPIRWVYKRRHMPMEVVEEFGQWRKLRDMAGDEGWAHQSQIAGGRMAVFRAETVLRRYPEQDAPPMIKVGKGVVAQVLECDIDWCEVQVESYKAWASKKAIWGVYPREVI